MVSRPLAFGVLFGYKFIGATTQNICGNFTVTYLNHNKQIKPSNSHYMYTLLALLSHTQRKQEVGNI